VTQSTWQVADQGLRETHQAIGDAGGVHEVGGKQEEGDGQQDEGVVGLEHLRQQNKRGQPIVDEEDGDAGKPKGERHRHTQDHQHAEGGE